MSNFKIDIPHFYCLEYVEDNRKIIFDIDFRENKVLIGKTLVKNRGKHYGY